MLTVGFVYYLYMYYMSIMGTYMSTQAKYLSNQVLSLSLTYMGKIWVVLRVPVLYINIGPSNLSPKTKT